MFRLFAHSDDPDIDDPFELPKGHVLGKASDPRKLAGVISLILA